MCIKPGQFYSLVVTYLGTGYWDKFTDFTGILINMDSSVILLNNLDNDINTVTALVVNLLLNIFAKIRKDNEKLLQLLKLRNG